MTNSTTTQSAPPPLRRAPFFPPSTNSAYQGSRLSVWFLGLTAVLTLAPGLIHSFLPDGGAGVIAHLDMGDRREVILGVFRWEGATQLALGTGMAAVAIRYRSLTAFFLFLNLIERGLMAFQGWVLAGPGAHHPPQHYASLATVPLDLIFIALALRPRRG
jgi:hypothetical protein